MSSILGDVKHALGLLSDNEAYDSDVIMYINSVFGFLQQLNVGPNEGYEITGAENEWSEFIPSVRLNTVKSYMVLRVRLLLDPPQTGFFTASMERQIQELEFRMLVEADVPA